MPSDSSPLKVTTVLPWLSSAAVTVVVPPASAAKLSMAYWNGLRCGSFIVSPRSRCAR